MFPHVPPPTYSNLAEASAAYHREQLAPMAAKLEAEAEARSGLVVVVDGEGGFRQEYLAEFRELEEKAPGAIFGEPVACGALVDPPADPELPVYGDWSSLVQEGPVAGVDLADGPDVLAFVLCHPDGRREAITAADARRLLEQGAVERTWVEESADITPEESREVARIAASMGVPRGILATGMTASDVDIAEALRLRAHAVAERFRLLYGDGKPHHRPWRTPPEPPKPAPPAGKTAAHEHGTNRRARRAARAEARRAARKGR